MRTLLAFFALAVGSASVARAGDLIPTDARYGPLRVASHKVDVQVDNQIALTRVEQVFANDHPATLEAHYVFPVPNGASVIDFSMTVNGKLIRGELLEKEKARAIYETIVQKSKDPGLLEYVGTNLFRVRVFPILANTQQKIEMTILQRLTVEGGAVRFLYPLLVPGGAKTTKADDFDFRWRLASAVPIKDVACPTHPANITRQAEEAAEVRYSGHQVDLSKDLEITYRIERASSGLDLVTHRPKNGEDGTFMALLTPQVRVHRLPKDVTFVFDTSGSMEGPRLKQAKAALKFCLAKLQPEDRFNVLSFASVVTSFENEHLAATEEEKARAARFVDAFDASGGTNIHGALLRALEHKSAEGRPHQIVFVTDGEPTTGETRPAEIVRAVAAANRAGVRIYAFGVGGDLNKGLLEDLAEATRGVVEFVSDQENIEVKMSRLQMKIGTPVISDVSIDWGQAEVSAVYPKAPGDLFAGTQLFIVGKFRKAGTFEVTLKGRAGTQAVELRQKVSFPEQIDVSPGVPYLWAMRKVAGLLDEIRRDGQNPELVREVIALAKEHRLATPYTSFLVLESEAAYDQQGLDRKGNKFQPPTPTAQAPDARQFGRPVLSKDEPKRDQEPSVFAPGARTSDHNESADNEDYHAMKGDSNNLQSFLPGETGGSRARQPAAYDTMGAGFSAGGARFGGRPQATDNATLSCLIWLARHQNADGGWSARDYGERCVGTRCAGKGGSDVDGTALSVLAFLGAGYTQFSRDQIPDPLTPKSTLRFGETVKKGLQWLLAHQDATGLVGERGERSICSHALATGALTDAYGMTANVLLKEAAQKAVEFLAGCAKAGWRIGDRAGDSDPVTTAWAVRALKSAELAELVVPAQAYEEARLCFDKTVGKDGKAAGTGPETAGALIGRILIDKGRKDPRLQAGVDLLLSRLPDKATPDPLYWHFATTAVVQFDGYSGPAWQKWSASLKEALIPLEKTAKDGCAAGSWDPGSFEGGRVGATALHALTLESYYYRAPRK
jgi:Ca-activated chloride channel family protein